MNFTYESTPLATGGEKTVYRGTCVDTGDPVVIKFLNAPFSHDDLIRFQHEIVRLQNAGEAAGTGVARLIAYNLEWDPPWYAEEYFPDGTLAQKMAGIFAKRQTFTHGAAVGYCRQLLDILHPIHRGNQVHRDVKPANIMVVGAEKRLVIIDMGLGRTLTRPTMLQTRFFKGTRGYAAPEQEMAGGNVDHRADLYAVGVILHEMLTADRGAWNNITFNQHSGVRQVVAKLLDYWPQNRYRDAGDASVAISALGIATR